MKRTLLAMIRAPLVIVRLMILLIHITAGGLICLLWLPFCSPGLKREIVRRWLRGVCWMIGLRLHITGNMTTHRPVYIVSNHISWTDIIVLGGLHQTSFLSKDEVKHWPVVGYLSTQAGTLYIKRGSGSNHAIQQINAALQQGHNITVFPEATTGNGVDLQFFYPRAFAAAMDRGTVIQPIALNYQTLNAQKHFVADDVVPLNNSRNFFISALRIIFFPCARVLVQYAPPITVLETDTRKAIATKAHKAIAQALSNTPE